ncbi:MAG: glycosyltransferase, partial [Pyrinomonadaceae bacterium]|nr:glycosyltransferase [Pyrinomonadaceae bacterium]
FDAIPEFRLTSFYNAQFLIQARECAKFIARNKIEIVQTHDFYTNVFGMLAAKIAGVKRRIAAKRETENMRSKAQKIVEKQAFRLSKAIVANAVAVKIYLINEGVKADKINVIYNGLDLERLKPSTTNRDEILREFNISDNRKIVTIVANLRHEVKNIPMFLRAAQGVKNKFADVTFVIAGEGELMPQMKDFAEILGIGSKVKFLGRCGQVADLLEISDVCVLSSRAEGFSNSILEYMSASRPVVATNVGGASEAITNGENGFLIESDNDEAMSEKLLFLLENPEIAAQFGRKGRAIVETKFSLNSQLKQTLELYERVAYQT